MNKLPTLLLFLLLLLNSCKQENITTSITSPNQINKIEFQLTENGTASYQVFHGTETVIQKSKMGFDFKDAAPFGKGFTIVGSETNTVEESWEMPWGEQRKVRNHYNELIIQLEEEKAPNRKLNIYFRAYDDGIGFRYECLAQNGVDSVIIMDENTEFQLSGDHTAWWIPGDWDIYEHLYNTTKISEIDALAKRNHPNLAQTYIPENAVNTPVTMRTKSGLHLSFHEANLTDYAGMTLKVDVDDKVGSRGRVCDEFG